MPKLLLFISCVLGISANAQEVCRIKGATVFVGPGLQVVMNGSLVNDSAAFLQNQGNLNITGDFTNEAQVNHSGTISLQGDWINNGSVSAQPSSFTQFIGGIQSIRGSASTTFGQLDLLGTGEKYLQRSTEANELLLNDHLLYTDSFSMKVLSTAENAIQRTSGYVFSERFGKLERIVISGQTYLFPVGRSATYFPVTILAGTNATQLGVRLADADASVEGLPRTQVDTFICRSNDQYYHLISGSLGAGSQVEFIVDSASTAEFPQLAFRDPMMVQGWQFFPSQAPVFNGSLAQLSFVPAFAATLQAFLMVRTRPARPVLLGDSAFCQLTNNAIFTLQTFPGLQTNWSVASGEIVQQTDSSLVVQWESAGTGSVSAVQTDNAGCSSFTATHPVVLWPLPEASMQVIAPEIPFEDQPFVLRNTSTGSEEHIWSIGDQGVYSDSVITVYFNAPGVYPVLLTVTNEFGCIDTATSSIEIIEGMEFPNSFSPNGDGINDELNFMNSGMQEFHLTIFDRWGVSVFETTASKLKWDGRTISGERVAAGTYFILVQAKSATSTYEKRSAVSVFD